MTDARRPWSARPCPHCGHEHALAVLAMTAEQIVRENWSYRADRMGGLAQDAPAQFPLVRCARCAFMYARLLPSAQFLHALYDEVIDLNAARTHSFAAESMATRMQYVAQVLPLLAAGASVLDFGCGFGPTLRLLSQVDGLRVHGFETSAARVRELRARHANIFDDPRELQRAGPYDAVIIDNVLEHVPHPRSCLQQLAQLCVPGGILCVSVPEVKPARIARITRDHRAGRAVGMDINPWEHLNYFDVPHLDEMASHEGFRPLRQSELRVDVATGLRPAARRAERLRNAAATAWRIARYVANGDAIRQTTRRLYRADRSSAFAAT